MQELRKNKRLVEGKVNLRLTSEARVVVLVVGTSYALVVETSYFVLPNELILELYNCYLFEYFKTLFPFYLLLNGFKFLLLRKNVIILY
jgi:hypothetical protein